MLETPAQVMNIFCSGLAWIFSLTLLTVGIIYHLRRQHGQHEAEADRTRPMKAHMTMGLRRSDLERWLEIDDQYLIEHNIRSTLLDHHKSRVLQSRPGSEAACMEVLDLVVDFLTRAYPAQFKHRSSSAGSDLVEVVASGEVFRVNAPFDGLDPLEIAARLAMEDFNVLIKGKDNVHTL